MEGGGARRPQEPSESRLVLDVNAAGISLSALKAESELTRSGITDLSVFDVADSRMTRSFPLVDLFFTAGGVMKKLSLNVKVLATIFVACVTCTAAAIIVARI